MLPILLSIFGWIWSGTHDSKVTFPCNCAICSRAGDIDFDYMPHENTKWDYFSLATENDFLALNSYVWCLDTGINIRRYAVVLGLGYEHLPENGEIYVVFVPYWFLILIFLMILFFVWRKTRPQVKGRAFPVEVSKPV